MEQQELQSIAAGQVLLKNCSDQFIASLTANIQQASNGYLSAEGLPKTELESPYSLPGNTKVPIAFSRETPTTGCCGRHTQAARPSENEVAKALAALDQSYKTDKFKAAPNAIEVGPKAAKILNAKLDKRLNRLQKDLAKLLTSDKKFVEAVRVELAGDAGLNPDYNKPSTQNVKIALALYAYENTLKSFKLTEAQPALVGIASAGSGAARRLATDFNILTTTGSLAQTRYSLNEDFGLLVADIADQRYFRSLQGSAQSLQDQIEELL